MHANPFSDEELSQRLAAIRARMADQALDLLLLSTPENIFYLTGLDHWGYFAPHLLVVPPDGTMTLITRSMERVVVANQVRNAAFEGHSDSETAADLALRHLTERTTRGAQERTAEQAEKVIEALPGRRHRIGAELWSAGFPFGLGHKLQAELTDIEWADASGLVDALRHVKSPAEQALIRAAARASDAGTEAAMAAIADGAREADVAAECLAAMTRAGGTPPGFGPFIRPEARIAEEHTTWGDGAYRAGERVMLEIAGCVARYNAPQGRLVHVGAISDDDAEMAEIAGRAFDGALGAMRPGQPASAVYKGWQAVVDAAGLPEYRRHHCGYLVGIGFPPSWTGGNRVTGLRHDADWLLESGMTFHVMSWFTETGRGACFLSNTVLLSQNGPEVLTCTRREPQNS